MSAYSNTPTPTKALSPTRDTLTAHAETNAYTAAVTYSEATQSNPGRQRRSSADHLTDQVTEPKRTTTIVSSHEKTQRHPTRAQGNTRRRAEQPQWNTDNGDEDEDDQLWTLVAGKKPTGKKAVIYVGNLKIGAKDNKVTEYIKRRCEKLCIRPPTIHNCKIFEKDAEEAKSWKFAVLVWRSTKGHLKLYATVSFGPDVRTLDPGSFGTENQQRKYQCQVIPAPRDDACERTERTPNTPPPSQISSHPPQYTFLSLNARSLFNKIEELSGSDRKT